MRARALFVMGCEGEADGCMWGGGRALSMAVGSW